MSDFNHQSRPNYQLEKPRRVRAGVKLKKTPPLAWHGAKWLELLERMQDERPQDFLDAMEYARLGQTRSMSVEPGRITSLVQGRRPSSYRVSMRLDSYPNELWDRAIETMVEQAIFSAKILAGELPENIDELFESLGARLFPNSLDDIMPSCNCEIAHPWCKHVICTALLLAERVDDAPMSMFTLRGMDAEELSERLRQRRSLANVGTGKTALHHVPSFEEAPDAARSIDERLDEFWDAGPGLQELSTPITKPDVPHALLRRLGPSPFEGKFPLLGLLATCYDTISEAALREARAADDLPNSDEDDDG